MESITQKRNPWVVIVLLAGFLLNYGKTIKAASENPKGSKVIRPFLATNTSIYRISTYEATVYDAWDDCKNLTGGNSRFQLLIIESEAENSEIKSQLRKLDISSVWTAGRKAEDNSVSWSRLDDASPLPMNFRDLGSNDAILSNHSNPRNRRSLVKADNSLPSERIAGNKTGVPVPKCRRNLIEECKPPECKVTLPECSIETQNCTATSKPECSSIRPDCSARCENCTVAVSPQCYAQPQNCTVKTPQCTVTNATECEVITHPCKVTRPDCPPPEPILCYNVSTPAPCTTRQPCIRNGSCVGDDCTCPIDICQVNATICPQPEAHCPAPIVSCPDPEIVCKDNPIVECDPPEVDCPKPTVVCTEAQVICSSPIVNCPAVITTCLPPDVSCPPPKLDCPPPVVECETPEGDCKFGSTPEPCDPDETTTTTEITTTSEITTTTERPCPVCGCMIMKKSNGYKWDFEKCHFKHRFICEAAKKS